MMKTDSIQLYKWIFNGNGVLGEPVYLLVEEEKVIAKTFEGSHHDGEGLGYEWLFFDEEVPWQCSSAFWNGNYNYGGCKGYHNILVECTQLEFLLVTGRDFDQSIKIDWEMTKDKQ